MFTVFLFPSRGRFGTTRELTSLADKVLGTPQITGEFARLVQRAPTALESHLLDYLRAMPALTERKSSEPSVQSALWIDGLLADALVPLAVAAAAAGARTLIVSPLRDHLQLCQVKLQRRGPLSPLVEAVRSASERRAIAAWATPDELDTALVSRVFGSQGPDFIFVEEIAAASSLHSTYRPSFKKLAVILKRFPASVLLGSAHASPVDLRRDVARRLERPALAADTQLWVERAVLSSPSLKLRVARLPDENSDDLRPDVQPSVSRAIAELPRPALVLCATNAQADAVHQSLVAHQLPVHRYHSGLSDAERARELLQFALPGRRAVMVAVSGLVPGSGLAGDRTSDLPENFGPGYCRRDLRSLIHLTAPTSLQQYASELKLLESGPRPAPSIPSSDNANSSDRAHDEADGPDLEFTGEGDGDLDEDEPEHAEQDGLARRAAHVPAERSSVALLFYHPNQLGLGQELLERKRTRGDEVLAVVDALIKNGPRPCAEQQLGGDGLKSHRQVQNVIKFLVDAGLVVRQPSGPGPGPHIAITTPSEFLEGAHFLSADLEQLRLLDPERLEQVALYAESSSSCRQALLDHLLGRGQPSTGNCGVCDVCAGTPSTLNEHAARASTTARAARPIPAASLSQCAASTKTAASPETAASTQTAIPARRRPARSTARGGTTDSNRVVELGRTAPAPASKVPRVRRVSTTRS